MILKSKLVPGGRILLLQEGIVPYALIKQKTHFAVLQVGVNDRLRSENVSKGSWGDAHQGKTVVVNLLDICLPDIQRTSTDDTVPFLELLLESVLEKVTDVALTLLTCLWELPLWVDNVLEFVEVLCARVGFAPLDSV